MKQRLIFGLLALNIVYFIWASSIGDNGYQEPAATLDGIPGLTIVSANENAGYLKKNRTGENSCYTLGPFNNKKSAKIVAKKISDFGLAVSIHKQKTLITLNYMVYLKPLPSREEAVKVIAKMDKFKIKEYSIVESGPYKNAIALGSFEDLDKARRHSEYVRFLGYDAKYTEQKKRKEVYWVDYDEPFGSNTPVLKWAKEVDPKLSVQKIPKACDF
jgi:hypothetical protein